MVSFGERLILHSLWPSKWYLPSSGKNSMVPRKPFFVLMASVMPLYEISVSKIFASLPIFAGEWASELDIREILSKAESLQFMAGSDERPVSMACMCGVSSSKHSSNESKPEAAPKTEKCGVQVWAFHQRLNSRCARAQYLSLRQ